MKRNIVRLVENLTELKYKPEKTLNHLEELEGKREFANLLLSIK